MFTGIVEETGAVVATNRDDGGRRLRIGASFAGELAHGQSVSVSGACLTVEDSDAETFEVFLSGETLARTYLDELARGDPVNLERALPAGGRLDGHVVQGHVDATAEVLAIERVDAGADSGVAEAEGGDGGWEFVFSLPDEVTRYVVEKGSIAVDGVSLTAAALEGDRFATAIIPATYELTTLGETSVGDPVHLEVDVLAKYVDRLLEGYRHDL